MCDGLFEDGIEDDFEALAKWISETQIHCMMFQYDFIIQAFTNIIFEYSGGGRENLHLLCSQIGGFHVSGSDRSPFGRKITANAFAQGCGDIFDGIYDSGSMQDTFHLFNLQFGGLTPNVSNAFFTSGSLNFDKDLFVLEDLHENAPAVVINGFDGRQEFLSQQPGDPEELRDVKLRAWDIIVKWAYL